MKITFIGAGSTIFVKNIVGDIFLTKLATKPNIALYDIDAERLEESRLIVESLNAGIGNSAATVSTYLGVEQRKKALEDADFVINTIQVGGYDPATIADFEIPKKYGLRQTIADTLGIGGIFRGLRTIPVVNDILEELAEASPQAYFLNYSNPMAIVTAAAIRKWPKSIGLCHSVQVCVPELLRDLDIEVENPRWHIAGINHMAWLLDIRDGNRDIYPEIKKRAAQKNTEALQNPKLRHHDMVRYEMMKYFGYYITESSIHNAEYTPFWIKARAPERIEQYNIPLDEYPRRCKQQIHDWKIQKEELLQAETLSHEASIEYASDILNAISNNHTTRIHGNLLNNASIPNLPADAIVEIPVLVDGNGFHPVQVAALPRQCAALNQSNINVQLLTLEASQSHSKQTVYQAAMMDPLTAAELHPDDIISLCNELFEAHAAFLPTYR